MFILSPVQLHHQNTGGMYCRVLMYILFRQNHLLHVWIIFRPHCRTVYVDAAYCYIPNSVICRSVCHSSEPCKNSWTDQDAVWVRDSGWPKNHVLDGLDPPMGRGSFEGKEWPIVKYRNPLLWAVKMAELTEVLFGLKIRVGPRNYVLRWGPDCSMQRCGFHGKGRAWTCPTTLSRVVQKWLNWSRCHWVVDSSGPKQRVGCTLAQPCEYNWTVHVRRWCGLFVRFLWPLVCCCAIESAAI